MGRIARWTVLILACCVFFGSLALRVVLDWLDPNTEACQSLESGIDQDDLSVLGEPDTRSDNGALTVVSFPGHAAASGPIMAWVDNSNGKVVMLRCVYDGPPAWDIRNQ